LLRYLQQLTILFQIVKRYHLYRVSGQPFISLETGNLRTSILRLAAIPSLSGQTSVELQQLLQFSGTSIFAVSNASPSVSDNLQSQLILLLRGQSIIFISLLRHPFCCSDNHPIFANQFRVGPSNSNLSILHRISVQGNHQFSSVSCHFWTFVIFVN